MTEWLSAAEQNLTETYLEVGLHATGAQRIEGSGYVGCLSPLAHPIANFAIAHELDPWAARELHSLSSDMGPFHIYGLTVEDPEMRAEVLHRAGFRIRFQLSQLVRTGESGPLDHEPTEAQGPRLLLRSETDRAERLEAARFMGQQFFPIQTTEFREGFASACADSNLEVFSALQGGLRVGAATVSTSDRTRGIYNVCVESRFRHRGLGSELVRAVVAHASTSADTVVLQCDPTLSQWYSATGFEEIGVVQVFARETLPATIM